MIHPREHITIIRNIRLVINKINKFVEFYAKEKNLVRYLYKIRFSFRVENKILPPYYVVIDLILLDYEREFIDAGFGNVYDNNPYKNGTPVVPLHDIILNYSIKVHVEYMKIETFVKMLLYEFPMKICDQDFIILNELYASIKKEGVKNTKNIKDL